MSSFVILKLKKIFFDCLKHAMNLKKTTKKKTGRVKSYILYAFYHEACWNCVFFSPRRPISEDEIKHLREHHYAAISEQQVQIDRKLKAEVSISN